MSATSLALVQKITHWHACFKRWRYTRQRAYLLTQLDHIQRMQCQGAWLQKDTMRQLRELDRQVLESK